MAIIDTDLLLELDLLRADAGDPSITDDCLWCVGSGGDRCPHGVATVLDGEIHLEGLDEQVVRGLSDLPMRLARAVVAGTPRPESCRDLPGGDRLVAAVEAAWLPLRDGFRRDPDVEGWAELLRDRIAETFAAWLFGTICTLSGGTVHRIDDALGGERWIAAEPALLSAELASCLRGDGSTGPFAGDPLRRAIPAVGRRASA